jgi:hypothetical protein
MVQWFHSGVCESRSRAFGAQMQTMSHSDVSLDLSSKPLLFAAAFAASLIVWFAYRVVLIIDRGVIWVYPRIIYLELVLNYHSYRDYLRNRSRGDTERAFIETSEQIYATSTGDLWEQIESAGSSVALPTQLAVYLDARRMVERGVMWLLRHRRPPIALAQTVDTFRPGVQLLMRRLSPLVRGPLAEQTTALAAERIVAGVPADLAEHAAIWPLIHTWTLVAEVLPDNNLDAWRAACGYLGLNVMGIEEQVHGLDHFLDEVEALLDELAARYGLDVSTGL